MGNIFNMDNKFFRIIGKVVDCVCLSLMWFLFCIPIVTAGAATTALYYTVNKVIRNSRGYIASEFWGSFKTNFKQSTIVWLISLAMYLLMSIDCYVMYQMRDEGGFIGSFYVVFIVLMVFITMWFVYLFPYIARFSNTTKQLMKNCVFISIGNLGKTVLLVLILALTLIATYLFPFIFIIVPAVYMLLVNFVLEKVFRKYMTEEDIAAEEERNKEYF